MDKVSIIRQNEVGCHIGLIYNIDDLTRCELLLERPSRLTRDFILPCSILIKKMKQET